MFGVLYCVLLTLDHSRDKEGIRSRISLWCCFTELSVGEISHAAYAPYCPKAVILVKMSVILWSVVLPLTFFFLWPLKSPDSLRKIKSRPSGGAKPLPALRYCACRYCGQPGRSLSLAVSPW